SQIGSPTSATDNSTVFAAGKTAVTYTFPVVCDNNDVRRKVRVTAGTTNPTNLDNINVTYHDISLDYDADTLALIKGYVDEDNNDIGTDDHVIGNLLFS
ncbi:hypothetical protein, partial [Staphylococcus aureus]|uniref:hypothetical protein n=1 Tax=Staphylococcus aureus TaxID=1280 RepID=UPI0039BDFB2D